MRLLRSTGVRRPWQPAPLTSAWQITPPRLLVEPAEPPQSIYHGRTIWVGWRGQFDSVAARPLRIYAAPPLQPPASIVLWIGPIDVDPAIPRALLLIPGQQPTPRAPVLLGGLPREGVATAIPKALVVQGPSVPIPGAALWQPSPPRPVLQERVPAPTTLSTAAAHAPASLTQWMVVPRDQPVIPVEAIPRALTPQGPAVPVPSASVWLLAPPRPVLAERVPQRPIIISGSGMPISGGLTLWCVVSREAPAQPTDRLSRTQILRAPALQPPGAVVWQPAPFRQEPNLRTGGLRLLVVGVPVPTIPGIVRWGYAKNEYIAPPVVEGALYFVPGYEQGYHLAGSQARMLRPNQEQTMITPKHEDSHLLADDQPSFMEPL